MVKPITTPTYTDFNKFCNFMQSFINQIQDDVVREELEYALDSMKAVEDEKNNLMEAIDVSLNEVGYVKR